VADGFPQRRTPDQGVYQVHKNVRGDSENNTADDLIANLEEKMRGQLHQIGRGAGRKRVYTISIPATGHHGTFRDEVPIRWKKFSPRPQISHVIFDFDGPCSWLRHGWPEIMFNVFRPYYPARRDEAEDQIHDLLIDEILGLNGKPSIHQ